MDVELGGGNWYELNPHIKQDGESEQEYWARQPDVQRFEEYLRYRGKSPALQAADKVFYERLNELSQK